MEQKAGGFLCPGGSLLPCPCPGTPAAKHRLPPWAHSAVHPQAGGLTPPAGSPARTSCWNSEGDKAPAGSLRQRPQGWTPSQRLSRASALPDRRLQLSPRAANDSGVLPEQGCASLQASCPTGIRVLVACTQRHRWPPGAATPTSVLPQSPLPQGPGPGPLQPGFSYTQAATLRVPRYCQEHGEQPGLAMAQPHLTGNEDRTPSGKLAVLN